MTVDAIFYTILGILAANFVLERTLSWLNLRSMKDAPPGALKDLYDAETYQKSQKYHRTKARLGLVVSTVSFVAMFVFLVVGGFGWLDEFLRERVTEHPIRLPIVFFGVLYLASEILSIPLSLYSTFVIEEKFGFNKMTIGTWVGDKIKGLLLTILLGGPLILLLLWMISTLGSQFWLWFWGISTLLLFLMNILYPTLIVPVFNKLTPLEPGELKTQIEAFGERAGFPLSKVLVMDGSKRSSKANAFFAGLGKTKRVVLYDTLIEQNETQELISVLAHEVGHFKKHHILMSFAAGMLQLGLMLFILSLLVKNPDLSLALGAKEQGIHLSLIAFGMLYSPISLVLGLIMNGLSRKNEYEADRFATETSDGSAMISALKKLAKNNLSNLTPHPAYVFFHASHPPLHARIKAITETMSTTSPQSQEDP